MEGSTIINNEADDVVFVNEREYDPNSMERLCCVELPNNNKLYLQYVESSTVKDVIFIYNKL